MFQKISGKIFSTKSLYILCFMALNLIELLRASQRGDVWYVAVNCMGLVAMVIVCSAYPLREFCTAAGGIYTLLCAVAMAVIYMHWRQHIGEYNLWQMETAIMNVWWIGIIAGYLFKKVIREKTVPLRPGVSGWLWIAMSMLMIASVSGRWWPLWYLLMFGSFYLTRYRPEDAKALWDGMIDGTILSFFCIQIYAYGFRPYDEVRYKGAFGNCNMTALYYLIVYVMCLYKLHILESRKAHKGWKLFYLTGAGGLLSFQIFTMGRTAWVTSVAVTILYGIFVVRKIWKKKWRQVLCRGAALILAVAFTFLPVYYTIRWLPTILHYRVWYEGEYSIDKVHSFDPPDSDKYVSLEEAVEAIFGRVWETFKGFSFHSPLMMCVYAAEPEGKKVEMVDLPWLDEALRGRVTIYKAYWEDLTWYGHGTQDGYYYLGDEGYHSWHAQNLWLQIAYYYGIPAGIILVALTFALLRRGYVRMQREPAPHAIVPFFMCVLCFAFGLMEVVWNPGQLIMFLIFFVQHPQMGREEELE